MTAENPFIQDLCNKSHFFERESFSFNYQRKDGTWVRYWMSPLGPLELEEEVADPDSLNSLDRLLDF